MKNKLNIYVSQMYKPISYEIMKLMDLIDIQCTVHVDTINFQSISKTYKKEYNIIIYSYAKLLEFDPSICENESFFLYLLENYNMDNTVIQEFVIKSIHTFYVDNYTNNQEYEKKMSYLPIPIHEISESYEHDIIYYGNVSQRISSIMSELSFQFKTNMTDTNTNETSENVNISDILSKTQILLLLNDDNNLISEYALSQAMRNNLHIIIENNDVYRSDQNFMLQYRKNIHFINEITGDTFDSVTRYLSNFIIIKSNINNFKFLNKLSPFFSIKINFTNIYEFAMYYQYNDIYKCINDIKHDKKIFHRFNCYNCISSIQNIHLEDFDTDSIYESVLIEFRQFPHIEFLLRNTIIKLGSKWNHTVVCGNYNYEFIKKIVDKIGINMNSKINIVKIKTSFITRKNYCELLMSKEFWELFHGEKLLIYQEDTCIFKKNIDDFIGYDYIGAPWPKIQKDNSNNVGNGGFSLRSRIKMIQIIEEIDPTSLELSANTMNYIKRSQLKCIPEDIYFSKAIIDNNIGKVATWDIAKEFSQESIESSDPFGGHCFWGANDKCKIISLMSMATHTKYKHNQMLMSIVNNFHYKNIISDILNTHKVILIDNIYSYFSTENNSPLYTQWVGILTCFDLSPDDIILELMSNTIFNDSIINCIGIIVYHNDIQIHFQKTLSSKYTKSHIAVKYIKLPCIMQNISFDSDINNGSDDCTKLCYVGCNKVEDISMFQFLKLEHKYDKFIGFIKNECQHITTDDFVHKTTDNCKIDIIIDNDVVGFIKSLQKNIVFMFANEYTHTDKIVLLIEHNVPFFINKTDSSCEYLGDEYPLYYDTISELENILNNYSELQTLIQTGHEYLLHMDKSGLSFEYFNSEVMKMIN